MAGGYHDFVAGEKPTAANLEDYCQNQGVMRFATSAARDSALTTVKEEGMLAFLLDSNTLTMYSGSAWSTVGPLHGALTSWTPTVTQSGSVTVTVSYAKYQRIGRLIHAQCKLDVTGSGTGANAVIIGGLPVTAATSNLIVGTAMVYDVSATSNYPAHARLASTTTLDLYGTTAVSADPRLGVTTFTAALASGDAVWADFNYEAASDA